MPPLILVPCTASKWLPANDVGKGRSLAGKSLGEAADTWTQTMAEASPRVPVRALYKGASWALSRRIAAACAAWGGRVSVVSAGLGLASLEDTAPGYDITFSASSPDTVPGGGTPAGRAAWWRALGGDSAIVGAFVEGNHDSLVLALPADYLDAVAPVVPALAGRIGEDKVTVLGCSASPYSRALIGRWWLRADPGRLRSVGGTVANAPLVALVHILESTPSLGPFTLAMATARLQQLPPGVEVYPRREHRGRGHAASWISERLIEPDPPASASEALHRYRAAGFACEQKAFHELFRAAIAQPTLLRVEATE